MSAYYSTKINSSVYVVKDNLLEKSNDEETSQTKQVGIIFTRKNRYFIYSVFILTTLIINIDNGAFTASITNLKNDKSFATEVNYFIIGCIGSISFLGNIIGNYRIL